MFKFVATKITLASLVINIFFFVLPILTGARYVLIKYVSNIYEYVPLYLTSFLSWFIFTSPVTDYFESRGLNYNLYDFSRVFSRNKMPLQNSNLTQNLLRENKQVSKALAHKFSTYSIVEKKIF